MSGSRWRRVVGSAFGVGLLWSATASAAATEGSGAGGARWRDSIIRITVDESVVKIDEGAFEGVISAISAWQETDPYLPTLVVEKADHVRAVGYDSRGPNQNSVVFMPGGAKIAKGALAITIITFDQASGRVLDADIVINGEHKFGTAESMSEAARVATYDLQNVLTHEFGHFLGLGEEYEKQVATMYAYSLPAETEKRDLDGLDKKRISGLYVESDEPEADAASCTASVAGRFRGNGNWFMVAVGTATAAFAARRRAHVLLRGSVAMVLGFTMAGLGTPSYEARVHALEAHWEDGVIVTTAQLQPLGCVECGTESVSILGGTVGGISQQVGLLRPLQVGDRVSVTAETRETVSRHGSAALRIKE
jgi:predicted Zn-dependent protease